MLFVAAAFAAPQGCDRVASPAELSSALERVEYAYADWDGEGVRAGMGDANRVLACLEGPIDPDLAARYHRAAALQSMYAKNLGDAELAFAASRAIDPGFTLPPSLASTEGVEATYVSFDPARITTQPLTPPRAGSLYLDGEAGLDRPVNVPTVVQYEDKRGDLAWSAYVRPGESVPEYPTGASPVLGAVGIGSGLVLTGVGTVLLLATCEDPAGLCENQLNANVDARSQELYPDDLTAQLDRESRIQGAGGLMTGLGLVGIGAATLWLVF